MAITLIEGFDLYAGTATGTGLQSRWNCGTVAEQLMATGRFGGQCWQGRNRSGTQQASAQRFFTGGALQGSVGFAFRVDSVSGMGTPVFFRFGQFRVGFNANGFISVHRDATQIAISTGSELVSGTWYYFEAEVVFSATVGTVTVYKNGTPIVGLNGLTGLNTGTTVPDHILLDTTGSNGSNITRSYVYFDDIYVTNTATRLGERRVETLRPNADTVQKDFARSAGADNFALVDEATSNGDTDYVQGSTVGDLDRYTIGALSSTPSAISAVQLTAFALKTDAATRNIALHCQSGATDSDGPDFALGATYGKFDRILETDPATSAAWTATGVNSLLIGPKVTV